MLAAYDIQQAFGFRSLRVYTFGSPRVGNHPFAREYSDAVPNTWTVINDKVSCHLSSDTANRRQACLALKLVNHVTYFGVQLAGLRVPMLCSLWDFTATDRSPVSLNGRRMSCQPCRSSGSILFSSASVCSSAAACA